MKTSNVIVLGVTMALLATGAAWGFVTFSAQADAPEQLGHAILDKDKNQIGTYFVPPDRDILKEPNAAEILQGKRLIARKCW